MRGVYIARYNDIQILIIIDSFRFIPLQVLSEILLDQGLYSSYQAVSRAVIRLKKRRLIRTTFYANNSKIIFLSRQGAKALATGIGESMDNINCPERLTGVNYFALEHTIKVAELYKLFLHESAKYKLTMDSFKGDHYTRYEYQFRDVRSKKKIKRYIMPDAEIDFIIDDQKVRLWVEYDRGTEYSKDVAVKYMKYLEYFHQLEKYEQDVYPTILFITESTKKRLDNLIMKEKNYDGDWSWGNTRKSYRNVVFKGVAMTSNIRNMNTSIVEKYLLPDRFLFIDYDSFEKDGFFTDLLDLNAQNKKLIDVLNP